MNKTIAIFALAAAVTTTVLPARASTFSVTGSGSTFTISRSGDTSAAETVLFRTVGLSAYAGQHFTSSFGTLTFAAGQTVITNTVTEKTPTIDAYKFQTTTQRSYRFELTDEGGFPITNAVRSITTGTQLSTTYLNREVTDLVYFTSGGSITSGSGNKYLDVTYGPSSYRQVTDGGYNQAVHTVGTGSLYGNNAELRTFLDGIGCKMYATVYFTQKEEQDGYQYIQILADNATTYDGNDPNGAVDTPSTSIYKACFILSYTPSGSVMEDDHYQFFPHRYDYVDNAAETSAGISHYEFDYNNSHLYEQKFRNNTPSYRTSTSGSLVLATSVNNLNIRFDAAGSGGDTWDFKNLKVRLALVDTASPVMLTASAAAAPGVHAKGNDLYVSVAFNEPVTCSSASLTTTWGTLSHNSGSGSNVLTFKGKISASASGSLNITSWSGTIKDLAGNELAGSGALNQSNLASLTGSHSYTISYDLAGGALPGGSASNPTSYTYESDGITLANPVRTGYNFVGWTGTGFSGLTNAVTIAAHSHGDRAYTAHWAPITYTVHFDANGGTGTMPDQCFTYDEPQALASNAFTRASFAFGGWRRAVGGATTYADGATVANLAAQQDDVVTLDAVWTPTPTWTGDGSSDSPYLITTREQLADLAAYANGGFDPYDDACYKLMADIAYDPAATNSYTPIYNGGFVFDGNGHTISGIRISRPDEDEQGLFGLFDGGVVKNLTLADSVIEGNDDIGGIVGRFYGGVIQNCFVIGTTISDYGGAVVGYIPTRGEGTLSNCAYHDCTPARGIGNENDRSGEVEKVFALSFGDGVEPIVPPQYAFPVYGETNSYYAAGQNVIVRVDEGAFVLVNGTEEGVTDLGNGEFLFLASADVAVTHAVTYIDASGIEQQCTNFTVLASAAGDATYGTSGAESWYVVTTNVTIGGRLLFNDSSVHLILCDGASLAVTNTSGTAISADDLTIYGQTDGTGTLAANGSDYGIYANDNLTINGGAVNATGYHGIYAIYDITINGGTVSATGVIYGICALYDLTINGGTVSATDGIYGIYARYDLTLGWTDPTDSIAASSYYSYNGTISVKAGQLLTDGTTIYQGAVDRAVLAGKTLRPYLVPYIDANGDAQVCTNYTVITSSDGNATYGDLDAEHWYVVTTNVTVSGLLCFNGDAHLILCDGATLTVTNSGVAIAAQSLIIYGQAGGTGALVATAVAAGICANYDVTINGGNVAATGSSYGIFADRGSVTINGGTVTATGGTGIYAEIGSITLGWTNPTDSITASSYYAVDGVSVKDGQRLTDGSDIYEGWPDPSDLAGVTLRPYISPWDSLQAQLNAGGTVTLTNDVTAADGDASLTVTNAVTLNLNGHTITHNGNGQVLNVVTGGDLTLTNSLAPGSVTGGGDHGVYVGRNAVFRLQGGAIAGNESSYAGGGVFVDRFGTFAMSGGSITNNAVWGGRYSGGGVYVYYGTFTMTGGAISGNTAYYGGGVEVDDGGSFEMSGGAISGNTAYCGGGVDVYYGTFTMTGGAISGNKARDGGGVYVYYGTFTVSGSPVISGSTNSVGAANNVYLYSGRTIAVDGLSDGARIGVTTETAPTESSPVTFATGAAEGDETYFTSDNPGFAVYGEDGSLRLRLVVTYTVRFDANGGAGAMPDQTFIYDAQQALASNAFTRTGYTFAGWRGGDGSIYPDGATVSNLTVRHASLPADAWKLFDRMPYPGKSNDDYTPSFGDLQNKDGDNGLNLYTGFENVAWNPEDPDTVAILSANASWFDEHDARNGVSMKLIEDFPNFYFPGFYIEQVDDAHGAAVTLTAIWQPHVPVPYIDADGNEQMCTIYNVLTNANGDVAYGELGAENWCVVTNDVTISGRLYFADYHAHLIVCDGATLTVSNENGNAIDAYGLAIHCQTNATGALVANGSDSGIAGDSVTINGGSVTATGVNGICAYSVTINGGNVNATGGTYGIYPLYDLTINGGNVNATGGTYGINACRGDITINGGNVSAIGGEDGDGIYASGNGTIILGWTNPTDSITASSYFGYVCVKSGQVLTDGSNIYGSHLGTSPSALADKMLRPAYSITLPEGVVAGGVVTQDGTTAYARPGDTVTLRAAAPGYVLGNVTVNGDALEPVGGVYSFAASAASITVTAATVMTQWQALQMQLDAGGAVTLANDVTAMSIDSPLTVTNAVTLDLAGHTLNAAGLFRVIEISRGGHLTLTNSVPGSGAITGGRAVNGGGVYVRDGMFTMNGGAISNNYATSEGGGVCVYGSRSTFTMNGGTISGNGKSPSGIVSDGGGVFVSTGTFTMSGGEISGNAAKGNGGGVFVSTGTFTMSGGEISGNAAKGNGGGVYVAGDTSYDTFTMTGGEISGNVAYANGSDNDRGGGGVFVRGGKSGFTMSGGTIISNSVQSLAKAYGGGVLVIGDVRSAAALYTCPTNFTMIGGAISGNFLTTTSDRNAWVEGGGVFVCNGKFTMSGGEISGNASDKSGGGVALKSTSRFEMSGGTISGNTAKALGEYNNNGGGGVLVAANDSEFMMTGGTISGNAANIGGGVSVYNGAFKVLDSPVITDNTNVIDNAVMENNVYLFSGRKIAASGLTAGARIGVTTAITPTAVEPVMFATGAAEGDEAYFFSDNPLDRIGFENGTLRLFLGTAYPAYLADAEESVTNNWLAWAGRHGAFTNDEYEAAFLLDVAPAALATCTGALLRVSAFAPTAAGARLELACDIPGYRFFQPEGDDGDTVLGNGFVGIVVGRDLATLVSETRPIPVLATVDAATGRAVLDLDFGLYLQALGVSAGITPPLPESLFARPVLTPVRPDLEAFILVVAEP